MSFEKNFCPSPWFHMRINNSGTYEYCRWMDISTPTRINLNHNIQNESPLTYFQSTMSPLRSAMLNGTPIKSCHACNTMDDHGKVSGRQKQLLKIGVMSDCYSKSLASSPLRSDFDYSLSNQGHTLRTITDWQIDLGNYCNGACVFCNPESSSRLATEFKNIGLIDSVPPPAWCEDTELLNRFINDLKLCDNLKYLHFLGGETVITPGFKIILKELINCGLSTNVSIGFTTNLTVWSDEIIDLLVQFKEVNLGMSVEALTSINDYVRYPSNLGRTYQLLERWRNLGEEHKWLMQLRITPTCLSVHALDTVYDYAWKHNIAVESCNFLYNPKFLRIGVLPNEQRQQAKIKLEQWIGNHHSTTEQKIVNTRDPNLAHLQILQDANSYLEYLSNAEDESHRLKDLVVYLKRLEKNRGNSILTYLPEYEELFRTHGY